MLYDQYGQELNYSDGYRKLSSILQHEYGLFPKAKTESTFPASENVWAYSCINLISSSFAQIPRGIWKKSSKTGGTRKGYVQIDDHFILELLDQPNPYQTGEDFLTQWMAYLQTYGNVWIEPGELNSQGYPSELYVWGADRIRPLRDKNTGKLIAWQIRQYNGKYINVTPDSLWHTRLFNSYDDIMGLAPLDAAKLSLDADYARQIFDKYFFNNNASPDSVLIYKGGHLTNEQKEQIRSSWSDFHRGPYRAGGLAVLPGDFDFKQWGVTHSVTQFIQQRIFVREEIATIFGVPIGLLNAGQKGVSISKEGLSVARVTFYENAIFPRIPLFRNVINHRILKPNDKQLFFDFDTDKLPVMIDYLSDKARVVDALVKNGTPLNQAFLLVDVAVDPVEGGDKGFLPGNFVPIEALAEVETMMPPVKRPEQRLPGHSPSDPDNPATGISKKGTGQSGTEKVKRDDYISNINPLFVKLKKRLGRLLFSYRAECKKINNRDDPFDLLSAQKQWAKNILPFAYVSYIFGSDESIYRKFSSLDETKFNLFIEELLNNSSSFELTSPEAATDIEEIILRSTEVLGELWEEIKYNNSNDYYEGINNVFSRIHPFAREVTRKILISCFNAGRYHSSLYSNRALGVSNIKCSMNHGRFPGDPQIPFEDGFCLCVLNYLEVN